MPDFGEFPEITTNERLLHAMKVAARAQLSPQIAHDLDVRVFEDVFSRMGDRLIFELRSYVYAEKIDVQDQTVPFSRTVRYRKSFPITWQSPRWVLIPFLILGIVRTTIGVVQGNLLDFAVGVGLIAAFCVAFYAFRTQHACMNVDDEVTVSGDVTISATYWNKFPDNQRVYPSEFGKPVRWIEISPPSYQYDDER